MTDTFGNTVVQNTIPQHWEGCLLKGLVGKHAHFPVFVVGLPVLKAIKSRFPHSKRRDKKPSSFETGPREKRDEDGTIAICKHP